MSDLTPTLWEQITKEELRAAAKVALASGGPIMSGAAAAWELRADLMQERDLKDRLPLWLKV